MEESNDAKREVIYTYSIAVLLLRLLELRDNNVETSTFTSREIVSQLNGSLDMNNNCSYNLFLQPSGLRYGLWKCASYIRKVGIDSLNDRNVKRRDDKIIDNYYNLFDSINENMWSFHWNIITSWIAQTLPKIVEGRDITQLITEEDAGYYHFSKVINLMAQEVGKNSRNKIHFSNIHGLSYFAKIEPIAPPPEIPPPVTPLKQEEEVRATIEYNELERIFSDDFKSVISICRAELNILFNSRRTQAPADLDSMSAGTLGKIIEESYDKDLVMCPTLMHIIMGLLLSEKGDHLINTKQNQETVKMGEIKQKLKRSSSQYTDDQDVVLDLISYATLAYDLTRDGIASLSYRKQYDAPKKIIAILKKKKLQADMILHIICNTRSVGKVPLLWINEISSILRDGGLGQLAMNYLSKIGITSSYSKIKATGVADLKGFWETNFESLNLNIEMFQTFEADVSDGSIKSIEIPKYAYILHADNYAKPIFAGESVMNKKFTHTVDSLTMMFYDIEIPTEPGFTKAFLEECTREGRDVQYACVKFSSELAKGILRLIRSQSDIDALNVALHEKIGDTKDTKFAHLRDFTGIPSVPVKSSVHAEVIQLFHILCNILFKTGHLSNNRFILCPNDPEFTLQILKFAITNHDIIKNCVLTVPPFHVNGHLLKCWIMKPSVLILLIGPFYEAIGFKPSVFSTFIEKMLKLAASIPSLPSSSSSSSVPSSSSSVSSSVLRISAELWHNTVNEIKSNVDEQEEVEDEQEHVYIEAEDDNDSGFNPDDANDEEEGEEMEAIHDEVTGNIEKLTEEEVEEDENLIEIAEEVEEDEPNTKRQKKPKKKKKVPVSNLIEAVVKFIDLEEVTKKRIVEYSKLSEREKDIEDNVKFPPDVIRANAQLKVLLDSTLTNMKRILYNTTLFHAMVKYSMDPKNSYEMLHGLEIGNVRNICNFNDLFEANWLTKMIKNSLLTQLNDTVQPFIDWICDGNILPVLQKLPDCIMYLSCGGKWKIVRAATFLYAELIWLKDNRPDILKLIAYRCTFLNEVFIEFKHSIIARKIPKFSTINFQTIRTISVLIEKIRQNHDSFESMFLDLLSSQASEDDAAAEIKEPETEPETAEEKEAKEKAEKANFEIMFNDASETRRQLLRFLEHGSDFKYVKLLAVKWFRHLILDYAKMLPSEDTAQKLFSLSNSIVNCRNIHVNSSDYHMLNMYFDKFDKYLKGLESSNNDDNIDAIIEKDNLDNPLKMFVNKCVTRQIKPIVQSKKPSSKTDAFYPIYDSILDKNGKSLASAPSRMSKPQLNRCIINCLEQQNTIKQLPSEDLIAQLKIWGTQVKPPIFDWHDEKSNPTSGKAVRTQSDNLHQYINCLPPANACLDLIKNIPWNPLVSFPLTKEMVAYPIQESSTKTRERLKHITDVKHITEEERLQKIGGVKRKASSDTTGSVTLRRTSAEVQDSPSKKQKLIDNAS